MTIKARLEKLEAKHPPEVSTWLVVVRGKDPTPIERYLIPNTVPPGGGDMPPRRHEYWNRVTESWQETKP
jgi:hypothetical protein